jgi:phosphoribosylformimino-5-aminoimidazole carboxamide ribotide isomerase
LIVIPAIDLKDGKCVRLLQGDFSRTTVYSDHPAEMARSWQERGAKRIHVVDLDGSREGSPRNRTVIKDIVRAIDIPVQLGGGIRNMKIIDTYLQLGISWVILGTVALKDREFVMEACTSHKGSIILGIDARDGEIMVEGWTEGTGQSAVEIAQSYEGLGVNAIVYTDINRDGMEVGVNIEATKNMAEAVDIPVIASGGVSGLRDIEELLKIRDAGIMGVIAGKALYTGALRLEDALTLVSGSKS